MRKSRIYTYRGTVGFFQERIEEIKEIMKRAKTSNDDFFIPMSRDQKISLVRLYNLNLRLLKIWDPKENRAEINYT